MGTSTGRSRPALAERSISSSASASCGTQRGCTKLVASTVGSPAASSRCDELGLDLDRDEGRLVLQAVARPDLVDRHARGQPVQRHDGGALHQLGLRPLDDEQGGRGDLLARGRVDRGDHAVERRLERELHLHRLHHAEDVALGHRSPSATRTASTVPGIGAHDRAVADGRAVVGERVRPLEDEPLSVVGDLAVAACT